MSRGHSWKSFKVPEPESRLLHILKWMVRWQDQTSSDSAPCLYSLMLSIAGQRARARTNSVFILRCTFLDLECKILDWQAPPLSKQSLSFVLSVWYPSCHDHYTLTHRRGSVNLPGSDVTRDPGRRKGKMRAREQLKQPAGLHQKHLKLLKSRWLWSKSIEGTSVHLELENSWKNKNLSALWIIFLIEVLNSAHLI